MNITKKFLTSLVLILFIVCMSKIAYAATGTVNADILNLRESPSTSSKVITTINKNQEVQIVAEDGKWYKVNVNGKTGYVHSDYINKKEEKVEETVTSNETKKEEINTNTNVNTIDAEKKLEEITISKEVNIYILPVINSTVISKTKTGEKVAVLSNTTKWLYVSTQNVNGWISKSSIADIINYKENTSEVIKQDETKNEEQTQNVQENTVVNDNTKQETSNEVKEKVMYVNSASIYVRKGPGTNYSDIGGLVYNNSVTVIGEENDWYKIKFEGKEGYVAKWLLSDSKNGTTSRSESTRTREEESNNVQSKSIGEQVVDYAKNYLDCEYVYGGSGPDKFDCSGFTMFVYSKFGINLTHSASAQAKKGEYVAKEDLMPGDLVFFKDYETMSGIGHCGIYIGNGDFIHASSAIGNCVKISTLLSGSYEARYETARRVL